MNTCPQCGRESAGAFCANCGSSMVGDDATRTSAPVAAHHEGWQDDATSTGYVSHANRPSSGSAYRSAAPYGATPALAPQPSGGRRGNQMLAALVALAALAVVALGGYLFLKPKNGTTSSPTPSGGNSIATTPSTTSTSQPTQASSSTAARVAPAPSTVTSTSTQAAPAPAAAPSSSTTALSSVPGYIDGGNGYAFGRQGNTLTVYRDSGSGAKAVNSLVLKGSGDDLKMASLPGCVAPILVWNSDSANSSAAFGLSSDGTYRMFKALSGQYDMGPIGDDGSSASSMGVHVRSGYVAFNDTQDAYDTSNSNVFDSCTGDGKTLNWVRKGE